MTHAYIQSVRELAGLCEGVLRPVFHPVETPQKCYMGRGSRWHFRCILYQRLCGLCWESCRASGSKEDFCNFIFLPLACEISSAWCADGLEFLNDLGSKISDVTNESLAFYFIECPLRCRRGTQPARTSQAPWGPSIKYVTLQGDLRSVTVCDRGSEGKDHVTSHFSVFTIHNFMFFHFFYHALYINYFHIILSDSIIS